jgi:hypothetical protein
MCFGSEKQSGDWISYLFCVVYGFDGIKWVISVFEFLGFLHFVLYSSYFVGVLVVLKLSS